MYIYIYVINLVNHLLFGWVKLHPCNCHNSTPHQPRVASASSSEEVTRLRARESNLVQQMQQVIVEAPETVEVSQRLSGLAPYVGRMG